HERNTCEDFRIPAGWQVKRGYDYGFSAPYAVLWVAISNGESYIDSKGKRSDVPRGSVFIIKELYGADEYGQGIKEPPSETAKKVSAIDRDIGRVAAGPADNSIFNREHGPSIADKMGDEGVEWVESNKKPGSRVLGLSLINEMVYEANVEIPERPVLKVFRSCVHTVDQLPHMQLSDKMEDVDTEGVDHIYDVVRYLVLHVSNEAHELNVVGF
ncbi:MAG: hypothetical protein QNJ71_11675, partial [Acidimicrobiia bacterium]|nr:hypothetical protein [Acidimicrobiia bacterium]